MLPPIKVGPVQPPNLTDEEIHASFRQGGKAGAAINHPLSDRAYAWLLRFNGVPEGHPVPWTWRYASNAYMREYMDRRAAEEITSEEPLTPLSGDDR